MSSACSALHFYLLIKAPCLIIDADCPVVTAVGKNCCLRNLTTCKLHPQQVLYRYRTCAVHFTPCVISVCISGYSLSGYPDLSVNFMAAKNPDILKWKSDCCGCLQKLCKLCLWYCGGTSNYSRSNRHSSKEWMVTLVSQTRSKECKLVSYDTIRYDTRCYFNVRSKADTSRLNLPHGDDN